MFMRTALAVYQLLAQSSCGYAHDGCGKSASIRQGARYSAPDCAGALSALDAQLAAKVAGRRRV